jgi:hypothetical protein
VIKSELCEENIKKLIHVLKEIPRIGLGDEKQAIDTVVKW